MNETEAELEKSLTEGIKKLLDKELNAGPSEYERCSIGTAKSLGKGDRPLLNLEELVEAMWKQIVTNWVERGCQWRGEENWNWVLHTDLDELNNKSNEVVLNRKLAKALNLSLNKHLWANEVATGSGLMSQGDSETGGLDFAYQRQHDSVVLIELKNNKRTDNPVSAAFQIVIYALVFNLARLVYLRLIPLKGQIKISGEWKAAKVLSLQVVAPASYYKNYGDLEWFEKRLNAGVAAYGRRQGLTMSFGFRCFEDEPTDEPSFLEALESKVVWN